MPVSFDKEMLRVNDIPLWLPPVTGSKSQWICQACLAKNQHINCERAESVVIAPNRQGEVEETLLHLLETRKCTPRLAFLTL